MIVAAKDLRPGDTIVSIGDRPAINLYRGVVERAEPDEDGRLIRVQYATGGHVFCEPGVDVRIA